METIEKPDEFVNRFSKWKGDEKLAGYPFIKNRHAPFTPVRRALPMFNLGLVSSAGAFIDGARGFDLESRGGDLSCKELPVEVEAEDLVFAAKGYDDSAVREDRNAQIPLDRLSEYEDNRVIGRLNHVWWSLSSYIPDAAAVAERLAPKLAERLRRYEVQAALLIPASRLCHQTLGIVAREVENHGIPTMMISVDRSVSDKIRPPRVAYYNGEFGSVAGKPNWRQFQLRVLDEAIRWIESFDQPTSRKLVVELESAVEASRGER
ncbi:MAG TPA: glycine/sarcosine/betaine reductase selenoprotein B family protein [Aridibacter sp.]|nr:glycine/sarcosine/betaine reductase selenoprotein B family protein [Aridibacter sp.]